MTDKNHNIRWSATYKPFGELSSETVWQAENNLRFPGQYHDRSTDLYYNMFRHYRPDLGRYLTPDPIGLAGGTNLYGYAGQNPINRTDRFGLDWYELPNGDFAWFNETAEFLAPYGGRRYGSTLSYSFLRDDRQYQVDVIDPNKYSLVPNVTIDFKTWMTSVNWYSFALRAIRFSVGETAGALGMAGAYAPGMPCDIKEKEPYSNGEYRYFRLFGQTVEWDDPGNLLYGYGATRAGYPPWVVEQAGGVVQAVTLLLNGKPLLNTPTGDHLKDWFWIQRGIRMAQ